MSCNIAASTPSFVFRLISDEMRLFLSNKIEARKCNLKKNYVCVVDTGVIDISFKTSVNAKNVPCVKLSASNNVIHIRTCADSFKALVDLISYVGVSGDIEVDPEEFNKLNINIDTQTEDSDSDDVHALMAEAMVDSRAESPLGPEHSGRKSSDQVSTDEEFCILEDDPGVGLLPPNGEPTIRMLTTDPIVIVENHFKIPSDKPDILKAPSHYPDPVNLMTLNEMTLYWHLYGGHDFETEDDKKSARRKDRELGVTFSDGVGYSKGAVFYGVRALDDDGTEAGEERESWLQAGGPGRDLDVLINLVMEKVEFRREVYPEDGELASRFAMVIKDIKIEDRLKVSNINTMLYQHSTQNMPRQSSANMVELKALYSRPDPKCDSQECSLYVSCKPLRLNIDQDSLVFLLSFFQNALEPKIEVASENLSRSPSETNVLLSHPPSRPVAETNNTENETFYRHFSFSPELLIRIDYQGKHVSMEQGAITGMLMGIGNLNNAEIRLKPLCYRHGLLGHHRLFNYMKEEWQQDIVKNQIPSIFCGVGPMSSFVELCQGIKNFFYLPVDQYRRDGQIVRGFQRGASALSTSTVMAVLNLTTGFFGIIQGAATFSYDMFSSGPSSYQRVGETYRQRRNQPADMREGLTFAANIVKEGMADVSRDMYQAATAEHEHKGMPGAIGGILRQTPKAIVTPLIYGSQAINCVINGVRHQLMPDAHHEDIHKWRTTDS